MIWQYYFTLKKREIISSSHYFLQLFLNRSAVTKSKSATVMKHILTAALLKMLTPIADIFTLLIY